MGGSASDASNGVVVVVAEPSFCMARFVVGMDAGVCSFGIGVSSSSKGATRNFQHVNFATSTGIAMVVAAFASTVKHGASQHHGRRQRAFRNAFGNPVLTIAPIVPSTGTVRYSLATE